MKSTRRWWVVMAGLAGMAVLAGAAHAQDDTVLRLGQERTYRWNELRTGYAFAPDDQPIYKGLPSNQMPAFMKPVTDRNGTKGYIPSPDLQWFFPEDVEGKGLDDPGNSYPVGNKLGSIHSSPTVASIDTLAEPLLTVMFGASQTVRRDLRNTLPPQTGDPAGGRASSYVVDGTYQSDLDPYSYLNGLEAGSVFGLEALDGTTYTIDATDVTRNYQPLWWYGVRSEPYYTAADEKVSFGLNATFAQSPSEQQARFFMNVSDSMVRAFDYSPQESLDPNKDFASAASTDTNQKVSRQRLLAQYLAPSLQGTTLNATSDESGPGLDTGAGVVAKDRPDIPERLTDRLYNLSIPGARFGLAANAKALAAAFKSSASGKPDVGPLNNRFRLNNGMGAVQSTGAFVRLPSTVTYTSQYYDLQGDTTPSEVAALRATRRDPTKMKSATLTTQHLYIVGSDDGYIYAFDANPANARRVGGGGPTNTTYAGRLVWAFRAAVRAPLYVKTDKDQGFAPVEVYSAASGESPGQVPLVDANGVPGTGGDYLHVANSKSSALAAPDAPIITGPIVSSPASAVITPADTAFNYAGQRRAVIFVGSAIGRLFCLDAATGQEIWEFKTTPRGTTMLRKPNGTFMDADSVAGYPITTAPSLGYLPGATSQLHSVSTTAGRLAVFFGADDGKVYALDAADGSPIRDGVNPGWDVSGQQTGGTTVTQATLLTAPGTRYQMDHFGFVTYAFESRTGTAFPSPTSVDGKPGRMKSPWSKPLTASVVLRPAATGASDPDNPNIPTVDRAFIVSPTNQNDATVGNDAAMTGGSLFAINPRNGQVVWTFDRWNDVTRAANGDFDTNPGKDQYVRPSAFQVAPAFASNINIYDDGAAAQGNDGSAVPLKNQNVLFAVDSTGHLFALRVDDNIASVNRLYWRFPYELPGNVGSAGSVYSSPVVSTPITEGDINAYGGYSYVWIGVANGLVAVNTVAQRADALVGPDKKVLPSNTRFTGGEMSWGWETTEDTVTEDPEFGMQITPVDRPVVTTPAIHAGYVWAASDSGYLYAWRSDEALSFSNGGASGGRIPYYGGRRPRQPMPQQNRPGGGGTVTGSIPFYVDVFQAGFANDSPLPFGSPAGVSSLMPTGTPAGSGSDTATGVTPAPLGANATFNQDALGGVLEWGDPVAVVAWANGSEQTKFGNDSVNVSDLMSDKGTVTFQLTGPSTSASLKGSISTNGNIYARQIFYLNPFGSTTPSTLRYRDGYYATQIGNPLYNQILPPGKRGQSFTVTAFYQGPDLELTGTDGKVQTRKQPMQRVKVPASTKFILANPLDISAYFNGNTTRSLVATEADARLRNGNEVVPVVASVIGDHGVPTAPQSNSLLAVSDRSDLPKLRALAGAEGGQIYLRARVQPARLRWMGGPKAAYKPLLARNTQYLPNGIPLSNPSVPPEPLFAPNWGPQRASFFNLAGNTPYWGAEQPPYEMGEENRSLDYPDINAGVSTWVDQRTDQNATDADAPVENVAQFYLRAEVPRYQPANFSPGNVDPGNPSAYGVGPGYYTVNPTNDTSDNAANLGWNPGASREAGTYMAYADPTANNNNPQHYKSPMGAMVPTSASYAAQEPNYLTKVYVDVNGNGTPDIGAGEAYRLVVAGVQVRPDERIRVANTTVSVPEGPEAGIPGGYIPFQYYYDRQAEVGGGTPAQADQYLFGERNFYNQLDIYNAGNVNLWDVRLSKYDPLGGHLIAPNVDPSAYAGADANSNWPASGVIKRFNLASTLDPLPVPSGPGGPDDASLWTPAVKPRPASIGDEGAGQLMLVRDVFGFNRGPGGMPLPARQHVNAPSGSLLGTQPGKPYITVAVPPGTTPGQYATEAGRLVLFEDSGPPYANHPYDGILDTDSQGRPIETFVAGNTTVVAKVTESRLTDKVSRFAPFLPNADQGVAMAANFNFNNSQQGLADVWGKLAQDATPSAYRDPVTGNLVVFWSSNRVGEVVPGSGAGSGFQAFAPFTPTDTVSNQYHIFATAMTWKDPQNPPIQAGSNPSDFLTGILSQDPWGWMYQGGNVGNFFFPNFGSASWFGQQPATNPWLPDSATVNAALGLPAGTVTPQDLTYTSPAVITDFHGTGFPPSVFWTGSTGVGPNARSAIFYAPIKVSDTGEVAPAGNIQAVGVTGGKRTLDPFVPKFGPRPFLITAGGAYSPSGANLPTSYLNNEHVLGIGVAWFGGAPGAWKLYVSTIEANDKGDVTGDGTWTTTQLPLPEGVASALHPSVYYHQMPKIITDSNGNNARQSILEVAFTGYSRSGRNPDIYLARYIAAQGDESWNNAKIGNWQMMGFARKGGTTNDIASKPLEPLLRVAGEPRPIYRSNWAAWTGHGDLGTTIYWFMKPVTPEGQPSRTDDYVLYATFTARGPGRSGGVVEATGKLADGGSLPDVTAFIDTGAGTVRFTTSDPVAHPAPLSRPYTFNNTTVQDVIYAAMNPYAMRVTTDDNIADSQPQIWLDETHDVITDQSQTNVPVSPSKPLSIRRDRLWVLWRRSAQPEGATMGSSLFYKTFRLGVDVGRTIPLDNNGRPQVSVTFGNGATPVDPVVVDAAKGRVYFTSFNDGDQVAVQVGTDAPQEYTVSWVPEAITAPIRYGTAGAFRLPIGQWTEPIAVPTQASDNDSQPWMFKDPFSDLAPGTNAYYARGNNNMWLFWASTRESTTYGRLVSAPTVGGAGGGGSVDPYYWDPVTGSLLFSKSASDVYYTTLSPDFRSR